jgi:GAF domain-containing protein
MTDGGYLLLAPFQGKTACIRIPFGKGVCGTAAETDSTQLVDDVHSFSGHIACDAASRSEIVVPIHGRDGSVVAVLDIDSPETARFTKEDKEGLEEVARIMEKACDWH